MGEFSRLRILVVEDEVLIAMALARLLAQSGCVVVGPAHNLKQGMQLLEEETIDGALLDVNLGQEKVFSLADALAEQALPFVYVTGYGKECLRQCDHARPVLHKPYATNDLMKILNQWRQP